MLESSALCTDYLEIKVDKVVDDNCEFIYIYIFITFSHTSHTRCIFKSNWFEQQHLCISIGQTDVQRILIPCPMVSSFTWCYGYPFDATQCMSDSSCSSPLNWHLCVEENNFFLCCIRVATCGSVHYLNIQFRWSIQQFSWSIRCIVHKVSITNTGNARILAGPEKDTVNQIKSGPQLFKVVMTKVAVYTRAIILRI